MEDEAIQYLSLDVHQATTVAALRNESGAICMRATEAKAIVGLVQVPQAGACVFEGIYAQWLHDLLLG